MPSGAGLLVAVLVIVVVLVLFNTTTRPVQR
jgi:hypothetical protein